MARVTAFGLGYEPTMDLTDRLAKSPASKQDQATFDGAAQLAEDA
jgi:hypothetical protein